VVFQQAAELRRLVLALLANPRARTDFKFFDQLRDAVRSPPRNIAEGFGRYNPAEFVQFIDVAIASLDEVDNHLRDGAEHGLFSQQPTAEAIRLCATCRWRLVRLRTYLRREADRRRHSKRRQSDEQPPRR
jgi:four helix bundle protein